MPPGTKTKDNFDLDSKAYANGNGILNFQFFFSGAIIMLTWN